MLLGPAGEAYFLGEEVITGDNPYDVGSDGFDDLEQAEPGEPRQSREAHRDIVPGAKPRASSAEPHHLQGALDGAGIDLSKAQDPAKLQQDLDVAGGYFLQELEEDTKDAARKDSPKSVSGVPVSR